MLIFIPKLNSEEGEREREILFCLFPSAAPVFSALGTIPPSTIPRLSDSQLFVNTIYTFHESN